jgi:hypothetical protein
MGETEFDAFVLANLPHFIAVNYQRLLEAQTPRERIERTLHTYNLGLRALTIGLVSQYLIRDKERVSDPYLNELLLRKFPQLMTLDAWQQLLFASLRAYEGKRDLFFMPELYDFYWDTSTVPHKRRVEVEPPFERLTQVAMEQKKEELLPRDEAGWERLAKEVMSLLQQILDGMAFIGKYDLIRVLDYDEGWYDFELHRGLKISRGRQPIPKHVELSRRGWFYLRKGTENFLLLHPFLVFWREEPEGGELVPTDTGVYDRSIEEYQRLRYLLAMLGKTVQDDESFNAFVTLVHDTIKEEKRQEAEKLTWWQLCDLCVDITRHRMATVWHKYRRELYVQRDKTWRAFERFLESKRKGFVLIGKSGVGKSNFLLALGEELHWSRGDVCVLMYDGANLKVEPSVTGVITQDFEDRITVGGRRMQQVWHEMAKVGGIEGRLVILCVDAINENPQAKELLRQLDELVQKPWPWLKVVVSSRPETWQAIKGGVGVKLAEAFYYREKGSEALEVELESFSYSERMEPFSRQELPEAYAKYRQAFKLQTEYEALPRELREELREPLNLWLVASTYKGEAIPDTLEVTELIAQYVDALLRSKRLGEEDLRLLERQLVPLMVGEGHYSNVMTIAGIDAVGGGLYEAIYSEQELSDGRRMNQSFLNLVDTDILVRQEEGQEQKIAFKYERFYDYFVGKRLFEQYERSADRATFLERWVEHLNEAPFLWGALRHLLVALLKRKEYALIEELGYTTDVFQCQLVVSVLTEYYQEHEAALHSILVKWLESKGDTLAVRITASVAMAWEIEDILERMLVHPVETVRFYVVQDIHALWKKNPELTTRLLHKLPERINLLRLRYSLDILSTLLRASLLLVTRDYASVGGETKAIRVVRGVWSPIIERFLLVSEVDFIEGGMKRLRRGVMRVIIGQVMRLIRNIEREGFTFSFRDIEAFFPANERQRRIVKRLVPHIDAAIGQAPESVEELTAYIEELARNGDDNSGIVWAAQAGLTAHIHHDPLRTARALGRLLENLAELYPPTTDVESPTASIWYLQGTYPFLELPYKEMERELAKQILEIFMKVTGTREFRYRNRWRYGCGDICRLNIMEQLLWGYALGIPEAGPEMVESIARFDIEQQDYEQIRWSVYSIAIGMERYKLPSAGVQALYDLIQLLRREGYLDQLDEEGRARFWRTAADDLVKYGGQYREQWATLVEMFGEGELPSEFRVRILNPSQEYNIDLNLQEAIAAALSYGLEDENPFLRDLIKWAFYTGAEADSLEDFLLEVVMRLIDLIYVGRRFSEEEERTE